MAKGNKVIDEKVIDATGAEGTAEVAVTEKEAKRLAKQEAKKNAKIKLLAYVKDNPEFKLNKEIILLVATVGRKASGPRGDSSNELLKKALIEAGAKGLSEMEIFKQFKIGRPEMSIKTRIFVKVKEAKDRVWIRFDEKEEVYKVIASGADMPKDWDGYIPADETIL